MHYYVWLILREQCYSKCLCQRWITRMCCCWNKNEPVKLYCHRILSLLFINSNFFYSIFWICSLEIVLSLEILMQAFAQFFFSFLSTDFIDKFPCRSYVSLFYIPTRITHHSGTCLYHTFIHIHSEPSCVSALLKH